MVGINNLITAIHKLEVALKIFMLSEIKIQSQEKSNFFHYF